MVHTTLSPDKNCSHPLRAYFLWPYKAGSEYHLHERCAECRAATRKPGTWVSRAEVLVRGIDPDSLAIVNRASSQPEPSLFDGTAEEGHHG
jgi:hypothetical protein